MFSTRCNSRIKLWRKKKDPKRTKNKPFINKYNWEGINHPSENDNWKKFEKYKYYDCFLEYINFKGD